MKQFHRIPIIKKFDRGIYLVYFVIIFFFNHTLTILPSNEFSVIYILELNHIMMMVIVSVLANNTVVAAVTILNIIFAIFDIKPIFARYFPFDLNFCSTFWAENSLGYNSFVRKLYGRQLF